MEEKKDEQLIFNKIVTQTQRRKESLQQIMLEQVDFHHIIHKFNLE